jgi:hypothetical protein
MKRREFIRAAAARPARSRASACGAIGVLMPHAQDNPVGPPRIVACSRSWSYWAGPLAGTWRLMFVWGARDGRRQE